ncbi:hypothetical protein D3C87_280200 [compost metagenome]
MSVVQILTTLEVREYLSDYAPQNLLIDGEEFTDTRINLAMTLAVDSYNLIPPGSGYGIQNFPSKGVLLYGTCFHLFTGQAALLARNTMNYSDGGLQIPIEERYQLYRDLAGNFNELFQASGRALKTSMNMEDGWGEVRSDLSLFPQW